MEFPLALNFVWESCKVLDFSKADLVIILELRYISKVVSWAGNHHTVTLRETCSLSGSSRVSRQAVLAV